jgi:hypothetical protein
MQEQRIYSFYGFHGTAESCALKIDETRYFEFGDPRNDHWLGQGSYFFREDEEQAIFWAKNKVTRQTKFKGETPCVIEVILETEESKFLNLDSRKGLTILEKHLKSLKDQGVEIECSSFENMPPKIRCFILSLLPDDIWMIQRTFESPSRFDTNEMFVAMELKLLGIQICVRNNEVIKGNSIKMKRLLTAVRKKTSGKSRLIN